MPMTGEIRYGRDIGYKNGWKYRWSPCVDCGKERWVALQAQIKGKKTIDGLISQRCQPCGAKEGGRKMQGNKSVNWRGGRVYLKSKGYVNIWLSETDFFYPMTNKKSYIQEHRLVIAKHLGRCLQVWEVVHHKNGIRDDNRLENLELTLAGNHIREHNRGYRNGYIEGIRDAHEKRIKELEKRVTLLEAENILLRRETNNALLSR